MADETKRSGNGRVLVAPEVADALDRRVGVVALESTIISHGFPRPRNLEIAREVEARVRDEGAVPATIAIVDGVVRIGLDEAALETIASSEDVVKVSLREVPMLAARGGHGATTVASTVHLASVAGIEVFATGGLGGVHRDARDTWDESADLAILADHSMTVVSAGVKSILDVGATLERLESYSIGLIGYGTNQFPGFYLTDSGHELPWRVDSPEEVAAVMATRRGLELDRSLIVANPLPSDRQLDPHLHERLLRDGLYAAESTGVSGKDVTPFLLAHFHEGSGGESIRANTEIILNNATLAAQIAVVNARRAR